MVVPEWDDYFLAVADVVRSRSKDPATQIGVVITGRDHEILSTGYNGFPRGVGEADSRWERPLKYQYVAHAERNAIDNAARNGIRLKDATLYLVGFGPPTVPCTECAKSIIQVGIGLVIGKAYKPAPEAWLENMKFAASLLYEAGVGQESW